MRVVIISESAKNCRWFLVAPKKDQQMSHCGQLFSSKNPLRNSITASDVFWKHVAIQKICHHHSWGEKGELLWDFPNDPDRHNFKRMVVYPVFILATMSPNCFCSWLWISISETRSFQRIMISGWTPNTQKKSRDDFAKNDHINDPWKMVYIYLHESLMFI